MVDRVRFRVLGPLDVRTDRGETVRLSAAKPRTLLAMLLLHPNRAVGMEDLSAALWPRQAPSSAAGVVRTYVSGLRAALRSAGPAALPRLVAHAGGYRLELDPAELDLLVFEELAERGQRALSAGDPVSAAALLRDALALWRGPAAQDVALDGETQHLLVELDERRVSAHEALADALLTVGGEPGLVARLRTLADEHPLRERIHGQLMLALYRAGRQSEALEVFHRLRRRTAAEFGVEPGPQVQRLLQQILTGDAGPDPRAQPVPPDSGPAVAAVRATRTSDGEEQDRAQKEAAAAEVTPRLLPPAVNAFTGRAAELAALTGLLDGVGSAPGTVVISAIDGMAGIGKTALAIAWAHRAAVRFPDGQLYVNLRGFDPSGSPLTSAQAVRGFLNALGVPPAQVPADPMAQCGLYRSVLAGRRVLIVLDNARDVEQVRPLLPGTPGCLAVVTSRRRLAGLIVDGAHPITLDLLSAVEARQLLGHRLGDRRLAAEPAAVDAIIARCARLPLALAIVAARAAAHPGFPLHALAGELDQIRGGLEALTGGDAGSDVRAAFSWSYQRLIAPAARMFRLLGLQPGPDISARAAASLAALPLAQARSALAELARAHLIEENAPGRYSLHDLLRVYAAERAHAQEDATASAAALRRLLDYYMHTAHAAHLQLSSGRDPLALAAPTAGASAEELADVPAALAWLTAEHRVLVAVVHWAARSGFDTHAWQLAWTLAMYFNLRGHWQDWADTHQVGLQAAQRLGDGPAQVRMHRGLGGAHAQLGERKRAHDHLRRALEQAEQAGDLTAQARAHNDLTWLLNNQGQHREALFHAERTLALARATSARDTQATALNNIGYSQTLLGDHEHAVISCRQAVALQQALGHRLGQASASHSLACALHRLGRYTEAIACYRESVELYADHGDLYLQAETLTDLGDCQHDDGQPGPARESRQRALMILEGLQHPEAAQVRALIQHVTDDTGAPATR
jgi:DNA-binding SARP family transcriptional activator/tetratricopeptide (TPR) repeat protein